MHNPTRLASPFPKTKQQKGGLLCYSGGRGEGAIGGRKWRGGSVDEKGYDHMQEHGFGRPPHLAKHKRTRGWLLDHAHNQGEGVQEMLMVGLVMF
jgi:hypothetical protein